MWVIRIKQYFHIQDYALWEVIENGDSWVSVPPTTQENGTSVTKMSIHVTAEEKTNKKNDYLDAKSMFAAIGTRFGLNVATKKTQKTLLKQQYENFSASSAESLDFIFNRLQKIVSRLAILGVVIAQEDLNSKFFSSLPPEWNTHVVVWMNKPEVETISIDDLYNNFKIVEQKVKKYVGTSSGAQNLAFMTAHVDKETVFPVNKKGASHNMMITRIYDAVMIRHMTGTLELISQNINLDFKDNETCSLELKRHLYELSHNAGIQPTLNTRIIKITPIDNVLVKRSHLFNKEDDKTTSEQRLNQQAMAKELSAVNPWDRSNAGRTSCIQTSTSLILCCIFPNGKQAIGKK
ncbi:hypothetical protein Tco_1524243 [Tanacetum coccineum]